MPSAHERFWEHDRFVVLGDSGKRGFPLLTYRGLKGMGKTVIPVDLGGRVIDGDPTLKEIAEIPDAVEAAVLELPRERTAEIVARVVERGIREIWIHPGTDTPEALDAVRAAGVEALHGNCAVMYLHCASYHRIHRWLWRVLGRY